MSAPIREFAPSPAGAFARLAAISAGSATAFAALGLVICRATGGVWPVEPMLLGTLIASAIALLASAPPALALNKSGPDRVNATLLGISIRFLGVIFALVAVALLDITERKSLLVWTAAAHLALLVVDTVALQHALARAETRKAAA